MAATGQRGIKDDRRFGFLFVGVFGVIFGIGWFVFDTRLDWALGLAAILLLTATLAPGVLMPFRRLWMAFAHRLGHVNNFILLGLFFYLFLLPAGLILRALGRDPMGRALDDHRDSYWSRVGRKSDSDTLRDMF